MAQPPSRRSDIGALVKELTDRMDKTKSERSQLQESIDQMEMELRQVQEEIGEVTRQNETVSCKLTLVSYFRSIYDQTFFTIVVLVTAELQQDYLAKRELETLIEETETSFQKINESIKTLICVVQKQEKHLLVKTGSK